jgi:CHASE2 domain-containing sensor protein
LRAVATDVVIVGIDDETARLGREVGRGLIDYAAGEAFDYVPLHSVLAWYDTGDTARLENAFGGKAILLGGVFGFEDRLAVPVNLQAWEAPNSNAPGVLLHAQALRNLLNAGLIAPVPRWIVLALCLLMAIGWLVVFDVALAAGAVPVGGIAVLAASTWLLARGSYLPPMAPLLAWTSAVGSRVLCEASL